MTTRTRQIEVFSPTIGPEEQAAVADVLASGWLGMGPKVGEFERAWAAHIGCPVENVVAVGCATEGLFQVMALLDRTEPDGIAMLPGNAYIGLVNAVSGAAKDKPVFCDIDEEDLNTDIFLVDLAYQENRHSRPINCCVLQHFGGVPIDLEWISVFCRDNELTLVEDCACAPASLVNGQAAGTFGDFGIWSFDAMKVMTCGDGGMVYCRNPRDAAAIRAATRLGLDNFTGQSAQHNRWWEFGVLVPGRRSVMNDIGAALGLAQLVKLPQLVARRRAVWDEYQRQLAGLGWLDLPPEPPARVRSSYYCYWVQTERRDALAVYLRERGIYTTYRYHAPHLAYGWAANLPRVAYAQARTLLLPLHANLSEADVDYICECVRAFGETA